MGDTKERILLTALRLFARDGYEAVSVSAIAGELGITKGALYRHYKSKRDIFDSIVVRMVEIDRERSLQYEVPKERYEANAASYEYVSLESIRNFTLAQFRFWTEDEFAANFRRMLILEQYRNPEMAELYSACLTAGPVSYMEDIFREMMKRDVLQKSDSRLLALEFFAPLHLLISLSDHAKEGKEFPNLLERHVDEFIQAHTQ